MAHAEATSIDARDSGQAVRSQGRHLMPAGQAHAGKEVQSSGGNYRVSTVHAVADRLLAQAHSDCRTIDPIQMQKLVYLAQGWALALRGRELFWEPIEVSEHGPVVPELHRALCRFGAGPIHRELFAASVSTNPKAAIALPGLAEIAMVDGIWEAYGAMSGSQLISLIDEPDAPWDAARRRAIPGPPAKVSLNTLGQWILAKHGLTDRDLEAGRSPCDLMKAAARSPIVVTQESVATHRAERSKAVREAEVSSKSWTVVIRPTPHVRKGRGGGGMLKLVLLFVSLALASAAGFVLSR